MLSGVARVLRSTRVATAHRIQRVPCLIMKSERGMAKAAAAPADAKAGGGAKEAKKTSKPQENKSSDEKAKEEEAKRKATLAALISAAPKTTKNLRFNKADLGARAAYASRFPVPVETTESADPNDALNWRVAGAAIVERIPLRAPDPTALEAEWTAFQAATQGRFVPRYVAPAAKVVQSATATAAKAAAAASGSSAAAASKGAAKGAAKVEEEDEGEGPGWGNDAMDDEEAFARQREQEEADDRDPVKRAAIDKDVKNIRRKRSERLYLIVKKPRPSAEHDWGFPQGGVESADANNLRQTAERELLEECGSGLHVHPMGNAPVGFYQYKFKPEVVQKLKFDGQKVFFHHMLYLEGDIALDKRELVDYAWASKDELINTYFTHSPALVQLVTHMLR